MKEHLFFSVTDYSGTWVAKTKIQNFKKLVLDINKKPGTLFIWIEKSPPTNRKGQLYKAEIEKVAQVNLDQQQTSFSITNPIVFIKTNNDSALKFTTKNLIIVNEEELKLLYAKSNIDKIGVYNYSIFHTFKKRNFKYGQVTLS